MASSSHRRWLIVFGIAGALAVATPVAAQIRSASAGRGEHGAYSREIAQASARHDVPERLIWAVIRVESGFNHRAVSPKGARGLMQLMPETAALLGVRDSFDPHQNIDGGTRHLRAMMVRFRHDLRLAVAAYNAGERPVAAHRGVPPYPETREYVTQVLQHYDGSVHYAAPVEWRRLPGSGFHRIVEPGGTVVYTNITFGHFTAAR